MPSPKNAKRLNSDDVFAFIKLRRTASTTDEIALKFKVSRQQAAAAVAILRIKDTVMPATPSKTPEGVSRWCLKR